MTTAFALVMLSLLIFGRLAHPLGDVLYDHFVRWQGFQTSNNIVIVAVDEQALSELGGWPLKRSVYSDLLKQLDTDTTRPQAIGFDLLFLDPSPYDDELAAQLKRQRSVIPLEFVPDNDASQHIHPRSPVARIAQASRLAHINLSFDSDGVIRGFKPDEQSWMHLSLALHERGSPQTFVAQTQAGYQRFRLVDPSVGFPIVSLAAAIHDPAIAAMLKDKYVLVGVTAPSLGDRYPTLYSGRNNASTPGVEILASILNASLAQSFIQLAPPWQVFVFSAVAVVCMMLSLVRLAPRQAVVMTSSLLALALWVSYFCLTRLNVWIDPSGFVVLALILQPLWSWRRLEVLVFFLKEKAAGLNQLKGLKQPIPETTNSKDVVLRYTQILDQAVDWAQSELMFLSAIVDEIPDAIAIFDKNNRLLLCNHRMQDLFDTPHLKFGSSLQKFSEQLALPTLPDWQPNPSPRQETFELQTRLGMLDFYLKTSRIRLGDVRGDVGLLILVDVTDLKQSQVQRDQALQFLSHDMRTPIASILALTRSKAAQTELDKPKIVQHAHALLGMMDDFILSISAQAQHYELSTVLLDNLINDAIEQIYDLARNKQISVVEASEPAALFVHVNTRLMLRVLVNVLHNAVKFSPQGSLIHIKTSVRDDEATQQSFAVIQIDNPVSPKLDAEPFPKHLEGFGLGLGFVNTVVKKHQGRISRQIPALGHAEICIQLPCKIN